MTFQVLFLCSALLYLISFDFGYVFNAESSTLKIDNYAVVIDAGSTGSRCFVFRVTVDEDDARNVTNVSCGKVNPGLSSFYSYPDQAAAYLAPLLINAAREIPLTKQATTIVHIKGTAGMRLLSYEIQNKIWKRLVYGLNYRMDVPFLISELNVGTIDGHEEAFFAVLASNYVAGSINGNLHPLDGMPMLGALDMGGSSTQLIFYNGTNDYRKVHADDFWSHSWLNYGVHRIQERVLEYIYSAYVAEMISKKQHQRSGSGGPAAAYAYYNKTATLVPASPGRKEDNSNSEDEGNTCPDPIIVPNPCGFKDHSSYYLNRIVLKGTGEGEKCMEIIERVIWPTMEEEELKTACMRGRPCPIESIEHPSVRGHHFYAMSVYFYALDCMKHFGPAQLTNWPKPTLEELEKAAIQFCTWPWEDLHDQVQRDPHPFTREAQLHDRCFESLYIITLLEKGFAFDRNERSITFALEVEGNEVEWTLGFALAEIDFRPHREKIVLVDTRTWKMFAFASLRELFAPVKLLLWIMHSSYQTASTFAKAVFQGYDDSSSGGSNILNGGGGGKGGPVKVETVGA